MKNYYIKDGYRHKTESVPKTAINKGEDYWSEGRFETSKYYQHHVYMYALSLIKKHNLETLADVGCGTGWKLMNLILPVHKNVLGIDQEAIIKKNQDKYGVDYFDYEDFDNPVKRINKKFDVIICADVIEHLIDPDQLLEYIKGISHKDTHILISTPERDIVRGKDNFESPNSEHIREWNEEEFKKYIENSGFEVLECKIYPAQKFNFSKQYFVMLRNLFGRTRHNMMLHCKIK